MRLQQHLVTMQPEEHSTPNMNSPESGQTLPAFYEIRAFLTVSTKRRHCPYNKPVSSTPQLSRTVYALHKIRCAILHLNRPTPYSIRRENKVCD